MDITIQKLKILIFFLLLTCATCFSGVPNPSAAVPAPMPDSNPLQVGTNEGGVATGIPPMGTPPHGGFVTPLQAIYDPKMGANFPTSWNDRRPIGTLFLTNNSDPINVKNPACWAFDGTTIADWDYSTTAGIQAIQQGLIALANSCVQQLKKINAQGVVCWDPNGEEFGGLVYYGSPNAIPWMVPEFDQVSDQFWNVFKAAGLRIGVALRADIADFHSDGTHSEDHYLTIGQAEADLDAKLSYAHDRWGCTLFYVDSNGGIEIGSNEPGQVYPATIFQYLQQRHPDCLIMPEGHYGSGGQYGPQDNYYLWTAGYGQYRFGDPGNDAADLASVPGAFMAIDISDSGIAGTEQDLISFVQNGGILMTRAWTDQNSEQEAVMSIYNAAKAAASPVSSPTSTPTPAPIASPTPSLDPSPTPTPARTAFPGVPLYDHIVVVIEENKSYSDILAANPPYIIGTLFNIAAAMTNSYSVAHPSEPNYFALYAGDTFGITDDNNYNEPDPSLATILAANGLTFRGYVEDSATNTGVSDGSTLAVRKHNPWESFPEGTIVEQDFSAFPTNAAGYTQLPNVSFVIPNLNDDMHNGSISQGDTWLQNHLDGYAQWALTHNSLLIVTWDEDRSSEGGGPTTPPDNQILTLLYGQYVSGTAPSNGQITHYNVLATIMAASGVPQSQWPRYSTNASPITQVFTGVSTPRPTPTPGPIPTPAQ
jgi:Phosphoesterase family